MDDTTRRSLHGVGELLIAGPQHRAHGTIRLRVTPGGFGGVAGPVRVEGTELVGDGGRAPLTGTYRALAAAVQIADPGAPDSYADTSGVGLDEEIVDVAADGRVLERVLRCAAPRAGPPDRRGGGGVLRGGPVRGRPPVVIKAQMS